MTTIVLRQSKLEPLTINEVDSNFQNLNNDKTENSAAAITGGTINGAEIGLVDPSSAKFTNVELTGYLTSDYDMILGYDGSATSMLNLWISPTASGNSKTINIGTGGLAGSTTNIALGSTAGIGTVTVNNNLSVEGNASCANTPTTGNNLTNKTYVDAQIAKTIGIAAAFS